MTVPLAAALLVQALAITLLRHRLGHQWLRHPTSIMILVSAAYQGVSPLLMTIPSIGAWDTYRTGIQRGYTDSATFIMSVGILALTITYLLTCPERTSPRPCLADARVMVKALDWRWLACACVPMAILTYEGRGYNSGGPAIGNGAPLTAALASEFFVILVVLTALSILVKRGMRLFLPVLATQSLILAATGERAPVIVDAITLIMLLKHAEYRLPRLQVKAAVALTLIAILAITGTRAVEGRALYHQDNGLGARVAGLGHSLTATQSASSGPGLLAQVATRLEGTAFAGGILQSVNSGQPRLSAIYVPESMLLAVPSALWPSKLAHQDFLNPTRLEIDLFGLQNVNFLPTLPGMYMGFLTPPWLIAFMAILGLLAGCGEKLLFRYRTPARLVLLAGAINAALWYEQGLPGLEGVLRSAATVAVTIKLIEVARVKYNLQSASSGARSQFIA